MTKAIDNIQQPRLKVIEFIQQLTTEQLNHIPAGFNNNIGWNLGHMIAAQQGVCYKRAGLDTVVDEVFFNTYKPGTKPEKFIDSEEVEKIKGLLTSTLEQFDTDLDHNLFVNYTPFTTRYGVEISDIKNAVIFLPFHDGLHIGTIMAMRRIL